MCNVANLRKELRVLRAAFFTRNPCAISPVVFFHRFGIRTFSEKARTHTRNWTHSIPASGSRVTARLVRRRDSRETF